VVHRSGWEYLIPYGNPAELVEGSSLLDDPVAVESQKVVPPLYLEVSESRTSSPDLACHDLLQNKDMKAGRETICTYEDKRRHFRRIWRRAEHAAAGLNDTQIAERVGCSVWTARKWRRRAQKRGRLGFTSHMGRPVTGPVSTFPDTLKEAILHLRQLHPGWGPNTLLTALKMDACWTDQRLPSRAEIARLLKHAGLTRRDPRHHDLLHPPRAEPRTPHQEWQMDAQGIMRVEGVGKVSLITIVDVVSRLKPESYPNLETTNPALPD
jgi:transposase